MVPLRMLHYVQLSCPHRLLLAGQFLRLSQTLMPFTVLRLTGQEFCRMTHSGNLAEVSPVIGRFLCGKVAPPPTPFHFVLFGRESLRPAHPSAGRSPFSLMRVEWFCVCKMSSTLIQDNSPLERSLEWLLWKLKRLPSFCEELWLS